MKAKWVLLAVTLAACGGEGGLSDGPSGDAEECTAMQIYVGTEYAGCGDSCPAGTTEAYQDPPYLACNECETADDCGGGASGCGVRCGPGCEGDTGGCCVILVCE